MSRAAKQDKLEVCKHCNTPLSEGMEVFCCAGCSTAYEIISGGGWEQYYQVRELDAARPVDEEEALSFDYLDTDDYRSRHAHAEDKVMRAEWYLNGLRCGACSWLVEQVSRKHEGIQEAVLNFGEARLTLRFSKETNLSILAGMLGRLGYQVGLVPQAATAPPRSVLKLGITGALAGNLMLMSLPFYTGLEKDAMGRIFGLVCFVLAIPLLVYGARDYFMRAAFAIRHRLPGLDVPIALGLSGAFCLSTYNLAIGHYGGLYYDSMGMLVFFLLLGKSAREIGINKAMSASRRLLARMPQLVEVWRGEDWHQMPAQQMVPGDLLRLRTGDVLPLDAVLTSEAATLNLHVVSGESHPVTCRKGDRLLAGAINLGGILEAKAVSAFNDSRFARLEEMAQGLQSRQGAGQGNRKAWAFLALSLTSALLGLILWWPVSPGTGLSVALTVLIVVCPCALALAAPVSEAFALKHAAAMGAWIKTGKVLENLPHIKQVVFDKTGILTTGVPQVARKEMYCEQAHWLEAAVAALETQVNHPLAQAFKGGDGPRLAITNITNVHVVPGAGIAGTVDGHYLVVSSPSRLSAFGVSKDAEKELNLKAADFSDEFTLVAVVLDDEPAALYGLLDTVREEIPSLVTSLTARGLEQVMLSGDHPAAVNRVAQDIGVQQRHGHMLPEQKLQYVQEHGAATTLMVGDGFNDMGALARASVGVTHAHGSEAALRFSGVIFKDRHMGRLAQLFELAATSRDAIRRGVMVSLCYNLLAVVLALKGVIGPLGAALLMPLSSLSLIALIALTFRMRSSAWAF